jgi:small conductance mechanosensitive channel
MDMNNIGHLAQQGYGLLIALGIKVLEAIALWIVGRWLIGFSVGLIGRAMTMHKIDPTLTRYINNTVAAILNIVLVVAILGFFGVETTSFAALLAAAGVAIGMAWSGLPGNFAAGVFIIILQPFKVGDFVVAGGVKGTVEEVGLFVTSINTLDNIQNIIGNGKILGDVIQNFSTNAFRRVDLEAQLSHGVDPHQAIRDPQGGIGEDPQRDDGSRPERRDPYFHFGWAGAGGASLLQQQGLLAGLLRHQRPNHGSHNGYRGRCGCAFSIRRSATFPAE